MSISQNFVNLRPSLSLDFANSEQLDPRVSFSRPTTASYYDANTTALAEQNLLLQSQFASGWTSYQSINTPNSIVAPDGTTTAATVTASNAAGGQILQNISYTSGQTNTVSVYAKAGTSNYLYIQQNAMGQLAWFNISTGVVGTKGANALSSSITSAGNGWYRCVVTFIASTTASISTAFGLSDADNSVLSTIGTTIYVWGAQLEQRSSVTAYNATTTTAITNYIPVLQTAPTNQARFDHDPVARTSLGLLIEQQSTNLLTYSSDFTNWTAGNITATASSNVSPDGTVNAQLIQATASGAYFSKVASVVTSTAHTLTAYMKAGSTTFGGLALGGTGFAGGAIFNLSTGVVTSTAGSITSSSIFAVGNGWYRCSITTTSSSTSGAAYVGPSNGSSYTFGILPASASGSSIFIWGAQLEALAFPTSYIPTVASQVTRSADSATMTGTNFSSWYNQSQGTIYAEGQMFKVGGAQTCYQIDDTTVNNRIVLGSGFSNFVIIKNGTTQTTLNFGATTINTNYKSASSYITNSAALSRNGATALTGTPASLPSVTRLVIGNDDQLANHLCGTIKKLAYYQVAVSATNLQSLTGS